MGGSAGLGIIPKKQSFFSASLSSNIEIITNIANITNIAKVTFIINTKGAQLVDIFSQIQIVLWLHFLSTASFHLWVCPNLQCFDLLNFLFTNRPSPSSYKQNHKKQEQEKRSMQYFLLWTKCANIRKALLRSSSRTWTKMAMGLWLKRSTLSKTSNCFLSCLNKQCLWCRNWLISDLIFRSSRRFVRIWRMNRCHEISFKVAKMITCQKVWSISSGEVEKPVKYVSTPVTTNGFPAL